ncbi:hypothetical protein FIBSPDRAFT_928780 [Athelia psychrophila]|uniref:DUF6534 domain-containing protein n=1 Tax=Athelia psychrophila TaxID=1759441 RepID=A0A166PR20_9AGAM|nr:hypothetical protein FIBSPDRAFT_928780 [Fibularhizoctonia sp. CBS 109695]
MGALDLSLGVMEVGVLINTFLYGVSSVQFYIYWTGTSKPHWSTRTLVPFIWTVDTISTIFTWSWLYRCTVTYDGNIDILTQDYWTLSTTSFFDGLVGGAVQGYFAYRVHILSRRWIFTIISWFGSALALVATTAVMVVSRFTTVDSFEYKYRWIVTTSFTLLFSVDVVNTCSLCWYLRAERTGSTHIDGIMNKMFLWTLETGILTSIAGLLMLIFSLARPDTSLWICIAIFYGKLYSNSLMASLNGREFLRTSRLTSANGGAPANDWTMPSLNPVSTAVNPIAEGSGSPREKPRPFGFMFDAV